MLSRTIPSRGLSRCSKAQVKVRLRVARRLLNLTIPQHHPTARPQSFVSIFTTKPNQGNEFFAMPALALAPVIAPTNSNAGVAFHYRNKIEAAEITINEKTQNLRRLEAQRNTLNARGTLALSLALCAPSPAGKGTLTTTMVTPVRLLREELQLLQEPGSYVGEIIKVMGKKKVLVKVQPEGRYGQSKHSSSSRRSLARRGWISTDDGETYSVVDFDSTIELSQLLPNLRVALRSDSCEPSPLLPWGRLIPLTALSFPMPSRQTPLHPPFKTRSPSRSHDG